MSIKDEIRKEAGLGEATTMRLGGENVDVPERAMDGMKSVMADALENIKSWISDSAKGKLKESELEKQAEAFMRNYLKGVYGK
jgi:hypothetical protein